jgi:hypothetical protein
VEIKESNFKNHVGGTRGSIELSALFLYFALFSLCLFINQRLVLWDKEIKQRSQSFTCFKRIMDAHDNILKNIKLSNKIIATANAAFLITQNPISLQVKRTAQFAQNLLITKYASQIGFEKSCRISQKLILSRLSPLFLPSKRDASGKVILKRKKWTLNLPLTFTPVPKAFLRGNVSTGQKFQFSRAREWSLI